MNQVNDNDKMNRITMLGTKRKRKSVTMCGNEDVTYDATNYVNSEGSDFYEAASMEDNIYDAIGDTRARDGMICWIEGNMNNGTCDATYYATYDDNDGGSSFKTGRCYLRCYWCEGCHIRWTHVKGKPLLMKHAKKAILTVTQEKGALSTMTNHL